MENNVGPDHAERFASQIQDQGELCPKVGDGVIRRLV
jgi:hypothetical protein